MNIYIEDITEDYGTHGVSVYSLVHGMDFYYAEVCADGIRLLDSDGFSTGEEMRKDDPMYPKLKEAILKHIVGEMENEN